MALLTAMSGIVIGQGAAVPVAFAAGSPDIELATSGGGSVLFGPSSGTALTFGATVTNPTTTDGYNLGFVATLPAGASYQPGSSPFGEPTIVAGPGGSTILFWRNVADVLASSSATLTFGVIADPTVFPSGATVPVTIDAHVNSDPRVEPVMSPSGTISGSSGNDSASNTATLVPFTVSKTNPAPEGELLRGVHDRVYTYTIEIENNLVAATNTMFVDDYLSANLEFLGCGGIDNTTSAATNPGAAVEYPGAASLSTTVAPTGPCPTPALVETVTIDPDGTGPLPLAVYTHVRWDVGTLAASGLSEINYQVGIPLRENTADFGGAAPATTGFGHAANLNNNSGPETTDEQIVRNLAAGTGTYTGPRTSGSPATSTVTDLSAGTAEDLRILKSVDQPEIAQGAIGTWTLTLATSEYRSASDIVVTDTLPDGLCPLAASGNLENATSRLAECNGSAANAPTPAYTTVTENADGTWSMTWDASDMARSTEQVIRFRTRTRTYYQQNFNNLTTAPVLAGDAWTNNVALTGTSTLEVTASGMPATIPVVDVSSAGQTSTAPTLIKEVSNPVPVGQDLNCETASWRNADTTSDAAGPYRPGDRVCFRLRLNFPGSLYYKNVKVSDFFPAGWQFERVWFNPTTGETPNDSVAVVDAPTDLSGGTLTASDTGIMWALGTTEGPGVRSVNGNNEPVFEAVFSMLIPATATGAGSVLEIANLAKATSVNSPGQAISLRDPALATQTIPGTSIVKSSSPANPVPPGSVVDYSLTVRNLAATPDPGNYGRILNVEVRDMLPVQIRCADVAAITNSGTCTDPVAPATRAMISWVIPSLDAQATSTLTYSVTLPVTLAPGERVVNQAGVRSFQLDSNTSPTPTTFFPQNNIDPTVVVTNAPPSTDDNTVTLVSATVVKRQQSSIDEPGNPANASLSTANETVTIGERIDYSIDVTIPAGSTVYNGVITDSLGTGLRLMSDEVTPSATLNGSPLPSGWTLTSTATGLTINMPAVFANPAGSGADVVTFVFQAVVTNTAANAQGSNVANTAGFTRNTSPAGGSVGRSTSATVNAAVREPRLVVNKTNAAAAVTQPGEIVDYTVQLSNTGSSVAHDAEIIDVLPIGVELVDAAGDPIAACTGCVDGGDFDGVRTLRWTIASINPGASTSVQYSARLLPGVSAGVPLVNTATATASSTAGANPDERTSYTANDTSSITPPSPSITKGVTPSVATIGSDLDYTLLAVDVPADIETFDMAVIDTLPAGLAVESLIDTQCTTPTGTCIVPTPTVVSGASGNPMVFWFGDLAASTEVRTIRIRYLATPTDVPTNVSGTVLTNTAQIRWNATNALTSAPDPDNLPTFTSTSNVGDASVTLREPRLLIDKDVDVVGCNAVANPAAAATDDDTCSTEAGASYTYTVTVRNVGDWPAFDALVTDTPSSNLVGLSIDSIPAAATVTTPWTAPGDSYSVRIPGPIAPGAEVTITYTADLAASATLNAGDVVTNTASIPSYFGVSAADRAATPRDYRSYTETPSDTVSINVLFPEVTVTKVPLSDPTDARVDQPFQWRIVATNTSNVTAYDVRLVDTFPSEWVYVAGSTTFDGLPATNPALSGPSSATIATFSLGDLAPGQTISVVYATFPSALVASQSVAGSGVDSINRVTAIAEDPSGATSNGDGPYGDTTEASAHLRSADVSITKAANAGPHVFGGEVVYTIVVTNNGPDDATGVTVEELLPTGLTRLSHSTTAGTWVPSTGTWTIGDLDSATSQTLTVTARIVSSDPIINTAQVAGSDQFDPDSVPGNGSPTEDDQAAAQITPQTGTIGDRIWFDIDGDGVQDAGEPGIPGIPVTITYIDPSGNPVTVTVPTDANGNYMFTGLPIGPAYSFTVSVDTAALPAGMQSPTFDSDGNNNSVTPSIVLLDAVPVTTIDFGYTGSGSIGDLVWFDLNDSRTAVADAAENGIPGVTVVVTWAGFDGILGTADDIAYPTTTNASGGYLVDNLPAGVYAVTVDPTTLPFGLAPTFDPNGVSTANTATTTLAADEDRRDMDFSYSGNGSIGDTIWLDLDGDGVVDIGEPGLAGVTVTLTFTDPAGVPVTLTTVTDANGFYVFEDLPAGTFTITVDPSTLPAGVDPTHDVDGTATPNVSTVTLADQQARADVDFGYRGVGAIGDTVWFDADNSAGPTRGTANEPGIPGVAVTVVWAGIDGIPGNGDDLSFVTVTGTDGTYGVAGLPLGSYTVTVDPSTLPTGMAPTFDLDGTGTANVATTSLTAAAPVDLGVDFSYAGTGSLGDLVWFDIDGDGIQDTGEPGIGGIDITVVWAGPDGVAGNGDDVTYTTTTDPDGRYTVDNLPAGSFTVSVDPATVPAGMVPSGSSTGSTTVTLTAGQDRTDVDFPYTGTGSLGDTVWFDIDNSGDATIDTGETGLGGIGITVTWHGADGIPGNADDVTFATVTDTNGAYSVGNLPAGSFTVSVDPTTVPAGMVPTYDLDGIGSTGTASVALGIGEDRTDVDFSYTGTSTITSVVTFDVNGDGTNDPNDPGISGVTVVVTWHGPDGIPGNGDAVTFTTVTGTNGVYSVGNLPAGSFSVTTQTSTHPAGTGPSHDGDGPATPNQVTLTVSPNSTNSASTTPSFGLQGSGTIGNFVWEDLNGNGVQEMGEPGMAGVTVTAVFTVPGTTTPITLTTTTNSNGAYLFGGLPATAYTITFVAPDGYTASASNVGAAEADSNAPTTIVNLAAGQHNLTIDAGFFKPSTVTSVVFSDPNGDGVQQTGEPGIGGVTVTLTGTNPDGSTFTRSTTTNPDGTYTFTNLPPGIYDISFGTPQGHGSIVNRSVTVTSNGGTKTPVASSSIPLPVEVPRTGGEPLPLLVLSLALMVLGSILMSTRRRDGASARR